MIKYGLQCLSIVLLSHQTIAQVNDTIPFAQAALADTSLRITNLNPFFTLQVDSILSYKLSINKDESNYYWFLRNSPVGLRINKDNGMLNFKADKSYFLSGKLKYDQEYTVKVGVQNLSNPNEKIDTSFTIVFYNTEVLQPKLKFTVSNNLEVEEGKPVSFGVLCDPGNFPIEDILFSSDIPITGYTLVKHCDDSFSWTPPYDFVNDNGPSRQRTITLSFVGSTRLKIRDTAIVKLVVKDALNYPYAVQEHAVVSNNIRVYVMQLKYLFFQLDKQLRKTKSIRTGFDLTAAGTALSGTILATSNTESTKNVGIVLPSVGVALTPIKEATSPPKSVEQNQASVVRAAIKRLEYMLNDNTIIGEKDPDIVKKINKLRDELKQVQVQLVDVPVEMVTDMSEKELSDYFNSNKVNKKYRLNKK
jgi:hypothetical protein